MKGANKDSKVNAVNAFNTEDPVWRLFSDSGVLAHVVTGGGAVRYLEEPESPEREVSDFLRLRGGDVSVVVTVPCCSRTLQAIFSRVPGLKAIVVADRDAERLAVWRGGIGGASADPRLRVLDLSAESDEAGGFDACLEEFSNDLLLGRSALYVPRRFARQDRELADFLEASLRNVQQLHASSGAHRATREWHKTMNRILNLGAVRSDMTPIDAWLPSGVPVVIVGAGPSLDRNVADLATFRDRVAVIATDASLDTLFSNGIFPDLAVSLEDVLSWQFFRRHFRELADVPLVLPTGANHVVVRRYPGPLRFTVDSREFSWGQGLFSRFPFLSCGQCVGHFAFEVARYFAPTMLVMMGFDLAFTGGRTHTAGMAVEVDRSFRDTMRYHTVPGYDGGTVETPQNFFFYLRRFEEMIAECGFPVWNSTEGGAAIRGAQPRPLRDALSNLPSIPLENGRIRRSAEVQRPDSDFSCLIERTLEAIEAEVRSVPAVVSGAVAKIAGMSPDRVRNPFAGPVTSSAGFCLVGEAANPLLAVRYSEIVRGYRPERFEEFRNAAREMGDDLTETARFLDSVFRSRRHVPRPDRVLFLTPGNAPQLVERLQSRLSSSVEVFTCPVSGDLASVLEAVLEHGISVLVAFNGDVVPDSWTVPGIACHDIKDRLEPHSFERFLWNPGYRIWCVGDDCLTAWRNRVPRDVSCFEFNEFPGKFESESELT